MASLSIHAQTRAALQFTAFAVGVIEFFSRVLAPGAATAKRALTPVDEKLWKLPIREGCDVRQCAIYALF
jgi:hypothetical protein